MLLDAAARAGCTCSLAGKHGRPRGCSRTPGREVSSGRVPSLLTECAWRRGKCHPARMCGRPALASRRSARSAGHSRRRGARGEPRRQSPTLPCVRTAMPPTATPEQCPWQPRYRECVGDAPTSRRGHPDRGTGDPRLLEPGSADEVRLWGREKGGRVDEGRRIG